MPDKVIIIKYYPYRSAKEEQQKRASGRESAPRVTFNVNKLGAFYHKKNLLMKQ